MAPVRVVKGLREAFKGTVSNIGTSTRSFAHTLVAFKPQHEFSTPKDVVHVQGVQVENTVINHGTKKLLSRMQRAGRSSDHGSSVAFKKVVRRRKRVNATALGLPSSPPIPHDDFQPQASTPHQVPATDQSLSSPPPPNHRQTVRESRLSEKHLGVPFAIYLACRSLNAPHRGPTKSVERHGSETRRSRIVLLARARGSPFQGSKRRAVFVQSSDVFMLESVFHLADEDAQCDLPNSLPSPRIGYVGKKVQFSSPPSAAKTIPAAPEKEPPDEMEDVIPAPLIYHHLASQTVRTVQSHPVARIPTVPTPPVQALYAPPSIQSSRIPPAIPLAEQIPPSQPIQPGQLLPTMSHFCRTLGRVPKSMADVPRALSAARVKDRSALPPTTPVAIKTEPSFPSAAVARLPPAPRKARLSYSTQPSVSYMDLDG